MLRVNQGLKLMFLGKEPYLLSIKLATVSRSVAGLYEGT